MSETSFRQLIETATQWWERQRNVSSKERLDEYFQYAKSSK